ncbi:MAG: surface-adhesin E family protein [Thermodesulfobacteriota bacterium]
MRIVSILAIFVLILSLSYSCADKQVAEPVVQDVPQTQDQEPTSDVTEQITKPETSEGTTQSPKEIITLEPEPKEEKTANTPPRSQMVKNYEPSKKDDNWFLVGGVTGERAYSVFVDPDTIEDNNGLISSWSRLEFENSQRDQDGLSFKEVRIESEVDCNARTYSYTDSKFYDSLGRLVEQQPAPYEPQPIVDGTVSSQIADFVCGYELNRPQDARAN